jgi:hypothetical protein
VHTYISSINKNEDIYRVVSFLKIICDYEHFLPLNIPVPTETIDSESLDLNDKFWYYFSLVTSSCPSLFSSHLISSSLLPSYSFLYILIIPLIGILLSEVENCLKKTGAARTQVWKMIELEEDGEKKKESEKKIEGRA